jgi:hypothetical protein
MQLPYAARCFRTRVLDRPASYSGTTETTSTDPDAEPAQASDGGDTDMLLIDYR